MRLATCAVVAAAGIAVWLVILVGTGRREAWDSVSYFTIGVPLMAIVCAAAGFASPRSPWIWGVAVAVPQAVLLLGAGFGALLPVGLILLAVIAGACALAAWIGALARTRLAR